MEIYFGADVKTTVLTEAEIPLTICVIVILTITHSNDINIRTEQRIAALSMYVY
jgi:hypothetical protein